MTTTTTKIFAAFTFTAALLLGAGCDMAVDTDNEAILGDVCDPAEIAGTMDFRRVGILLGDAEYGTWEISPVVVHRAPSYAEMEILTDELCTQLRDLDGPERSRLQHRLAAEAVTTIAADLEDEPEAPYDDNMLPPSALTASSWDELEAADASADAAADRERDVTVGQVAGRTRDARPGEVLEPAERIESYDPDLPVHGDRRDAGDEVAECVTFSHPMIGENCLLCCMGVDCYAACEEYALDEGPHRS